MATLLFAVGVKEAPVELLCYVIRNNHDNPLLLDEVQRIFDKARMGEEGLALIRASKKEASDLMNQGVLLWKTGKMDEAVAWMRHARKALPNNHAHPVQCGADHALAHAAARLRRRARAEAARGADARRPACSRASSALPS